MGVPGFFMWLWKNYKRNSFVFRKEKLIIEDLSKISSISSDKLEKITLQNDFNKKLIDDINNIDYFLIDTNCLIHPMCFKILAENPEFKDIDVLENKMITQVINYISELISYVKPKKGVFIAIDGVAPVAKIKQQRSRRFKSVHDKNLWDTIKKKHNKPINNFWNNSAITPGTKFMNKLHNQIIEWAKLQTLQIIYSSCNTPSEGEHKLLQFIRNNQKNNKHFYYVLYGLDADLIFLALSTNYNNIYLLREANQMNKNEPENILNYVSIKIMRESINKTMKGYFIELINNDNNEIEKCLNDKCFIDDFIFLCYLLGNDFLPHLPSLDIHKDGIEYLIKAFVEISFENNFEKIINTSKQISINQEFLIKLINKLSINENAILRENYCHNKKYFKCDSNDSYDIEIHKIENLLFKIKDPIELGSDEPIEWRKRYYKHYFGCEESIEDFSKNLVKHYLLGLKWITHYYFDKCPSWDWYYPFEHPPFLNDINIYIHSFNINDFKFNIGKPLKPFMQLLCVLPQQSSYLLPKTLQKLMNNPNSSLSHLYPIDFEQDFINKHRYWMGIPLLPPLEIELVKYIYTKYQDELSKEDILKNRQEDNYIFN